MTLNDKTADNRAKISAETWAELQLGVHTQHSELSCQLHDGTRKTPI